MRKVLGTLIISCLCIPVFSQSGYFAIGYNVNKFTSDSLNYVIDRYNDTRAYLENEMPYPEVLKGLDLHIGGGKEVVFDLGFSWRTAVVSANGIDATNTNTQRDLKYKKGAWDFALGYNLTNYRRHDIILGYNQTFGFEKFFTRVGPAESIDDADYFKIINDLTAAGEFFVQLDLPLGEAVALIVRPYYHIDLLAFDYGDVNRAINANTAGADSYLLKSKAKGFGLSVLLGIGEWND